MINLLNTTLIIPIKIEHQDRYRNSKIVLNFLNSNMMTNVFIYETSDTGQTKLDFLEGLKNLRIKHWCIQDEEFFHRTKYLNIMLDEVDTPVVVNYDIDVILNPWNFLECQNQIVNKKYKVIYPYELGNGQVMVMEDFDYLGFEKNNYKIDFIENSVNTKIYSSECGHCIFFNTEIYKKLGGENENFISYGPEDKERMYRFQALTNSVSWRKGEKVYHFEHYRGNDSLSLNPYFDSNWKEFEKIKSMDIINLIEYYNNISYPNKYKNISKNTIQG